MSENCFSCKYHKLEGDTYWSKWICKLHGGLPDEEICDDYKKSSWLDRLLQR